VFQIQLVIRVNSAGVQLIEQRIVVVIREEGHLPRAYRIVLEGLRLTRPLLSAKLSNAIGLLLVFLATATTAVSASLSFPASQKGTASAAAFINPKDFGAIGDCQSHPLSSVYASLAAARAVYPFITSLSQQVDYAAIKAASNAAFGADGTEHGYTNRALNKPLYFPGGCYNLGDDTWLVRNAVGIHINGAARMTTRVVSNRTPFRTDGLWYSQVEGIEFASLTNTATVAFDIDGNVPGHPYDTRGVQGNTFKDVFVDGGGSSYAFALCRQGQSGGQCSENLFLDLHLTNASFAVYYQYGYNALNNTFIGGNFQNYPKHGIYLVAGSVNLFSVGFQSTYQYRQILEGGFDIDASSAGVYDRIIVDGCRTESLRFYNGAFSQYGILRGVQQRASVFEWSANAALTLNTVLVGKTGVGEKLFRATEAGTTGRSQPVWPSSGTIRDGTVTWTETEFEVVHLVAGEVSGSSFQVGNVVQPPPTSSTPAEAMASSSSASENYSSSISIKRGGGTNIGRVGNWWQVTGGWALDRLSYRELTENIASSSRPFPPDGTQFYCTDCDSPLVPGAACSSSKDKAGAEAHRIRGAWKCF
jgi:hypothetical protein